MKQYKTCSGELLEGVKVYLSGAIESDPTDGVEWRSKIKRQCLERGIMLDVIDPTSKLNWETKEIGEERETMRKLKEEGNFEELTKKMKKIRRWDLRAVDYAHFLIAYIHKDIPTWGTVDECIIAERQKKPIYAIIPGGIKNAPDWAFAVINWQDMFTAIEDCVEHLYKLNYGTISLDDRWVII